VRPWCAQSSRWPPLELFELEVPEFESSPRAAGLAAGAGVEVLDGAVTVLLGAALLGGVGVTVAGGVLDGRAIGAGTAEEPLEAGADVVVE
jgi:hypothetical protein